MQHAYPDFRKRLDSVLCRRDPASLRAFLVEEGQWDADTTTDPARAMWMMIATSPALTAMHGEAIAWLSQHGYAEEANALERRGDSRPSRSGRPGRNNGQRRSPHRPPNRCNSPA